MCGRYVSPDEASIEREFDLPASGWKLAASFNVAPTQAVPVIRADGGRARAALLRWGLVPFFANGVPGKYSTINARIETVESSASYRGPWKRGQRCIVPACGFYEWHLNADGTKQPFYIYLKDQQLFGFAGLWDRSQRDDGEAVESFTIITMPANPFMAAIHNTKGRMPAILQRQRRDAWLEGDLTAARQALAGYPDGQMAAHPVSARVNSPRNNDRRLLDPVPPTSIWPPVP